MDNEPDIRYNYEATDADLQMLSEIAGSRISVKQFEELIDLFERENAEEEAVKQFESISIPNIGSKSQRSDYEKIYKVMELYAICFISIGKRLEKAEESPCSENIGKHLMQIIMIRELLLESARKTRGN